MQPFSIKSPVGQQTMEVDPTHLAARIAIRPVDHGLQGQLLGHYRASLVTGLTVSIAAAGILASLRWAATNYLVLMRIDASACCGTAVTTVVNMGELAAFIFRGSTGNAASGTAVSLLGNNQKTRQIMGASQVADLRVSAAGALTAAGGKTNDGVPFATAVLQFPSVVTQTVAAPAPKVNLYRWDALGQHPVVLSPNEGIEIQNVDTGPTTGQVKYFFDFEWAEVAVF